MNEIDKVYNDFWKDIIEKEDGSINLEQLKRELYDYSTLIDNVFRVYDNITNGKFSKPNTDPMYIIQEVEDIIDKAYKEGYDEGQGYMGLFL